MSSSHNQSTSQSGTSAEQQAEYNEVVDYLKTKGGRGRSLARYQTVLTKQVSIGSELHAAVLACASDKGGTSEQTALVRDALWKANANQKIKNLGWAKDEKQAARIISIGAIQDWAKNPPSLSTRWQAYGPSYGASGTGQQQSANQAHPFNAGSGVDPSQFGSHTYPNQNFASPAGGSSGYGGSGYGTPSSGAAHPNAGSLQSYPVSPAGFPQQNTATGAGQAATQYGYSNAQYGYSDAQYGYSVPQTHDNSQVGGQAAGSSNPPPEKDEMELVYNWKTGQTSYRPKKN